VKVSAAARARHAPGCTFKQIEVRDSSAGITEHRAVLVRSKVSDTTYVVKALADAAKLSNMILPTCVDVHRRCTGCISAFGC